MAKKKYCKIHILPCKGNFEIKYINTINDISPVWKITGRTYVSSLKKNETFGNDIKSIMSTLKQSISRNIPSSPFDKNFIFDYDFVKNTKPSFKNKIVTFDLFLRQKENTDIEKGLLSLLENNICELTERFNKTNLKITSTRN